MLIFFMIVFLVIMVIGLVILVKGNELFGALLALTGFLCGLILIVIWAVSSHGHFVDNCHNQGGRVMDLGHNEICLSPDNVYLGHD